MRKSFFLFSRRDVGARIKDRLKLMLGAIVYPVQGRRWRRFVRSNAVLSELAQRYPRICHKIYRPYLCSRLMCADRVDILMAHYRYMFNAGLGDLVSQAAMAAVPLAEFSGKSGAVFQLQLSAINDGHREGELTVKLMSDGQCIYAASFVLITIGHQPCVAIGALQGLSSLEGAAIIKAATRELHGFRPKNLMVAVVRVIGQYLGCSNMLLISNQNRIAVNGRRARRISSNYDETWAEIGAIKREDGNYTLPCAIPEQDLESVPSHKRSQARRRNTMLGSLSMAVTANLDSRVRRAPRIPALHERAAWQSFTVTLADSESFEPGKMGISVPSIRGALTQRPDRVISNDLCGNRIRRLLRIAPIRPQLPARAWPRQPS